MFRKHHGPEGHIELDDDFSSIDIRLLQTAEKMERERDLRLPEIDRLPFLMHEVEPLPPEIFHQSTDRFGPRRTWEQARRYGAYALVAGALVSTIPLRTHH
jgi:hypothetical protein